MKSVWFVFIISLLDFVYAPLGYYLMSFDLEREALIASGLKEGDRITRYLTRLQHLHVQFLSNVTTSDSALTRAKQLFDWLWNDRPNRYRPKGSYRLYEVIDTQISGESESVGNCLGLTLLYNCLLRKSGIKAKGLNLENAFGTRPHVLTFLKAERLTIDVENIVPEGFDYKGHLKNLSRTVWGDKELVADIYHSLGNDFFEKQEFNSALFHYDLALKLNPEYEKARMNKVILLDKMETETE